MSGVASHPCWLGITQRSTAAGCRCRAVPLSAAVWAPALWVRGADGCGVWRLCDGAPDSWCRVASGRSDV